MTDAQSAYTRIHERYRELYEKGYSPEIVIMHPEMARSIMLADLPWVRREPQGTLAELYTDYGIVSVLLDETWPIDTFHMTARGWHPQRPPPQIINMRLIAAKGEDT